jgi:hypothetical protein
MKKHRTPLRLALSRTTVRPLTAADLARAAGAAPPPPPTSHDSHAEAFDGATPATNCTAGSGTN